MQHIEQAPVRKVVYVDQWHVVEWRRASGAVVQQDAVITEKTLLFETKKIDYGYPIN